MRASVTAPLLAFLAAASPAIGAAAAVAAGVMAAEGSARAQRDAGDALSGLSDEVGTLERSRAELEQRRAGLDGQSRDEARLIDGLKQQAPGIGRDVQLGQLMASTEERSRRLEQLAAELRAMDRRLEGKRRELLGACERALSSPSLAADRRAALARLRAETASRIAGAAEASSVAIAIAIDGPASGGGAASAQPRPNGYASPSLSGSLAPATAVDLLASPHELDEKADRIKDDEDKLRREAERVERRISGLEEQRRLRERAGALEDDLFVESAFGRRALRVDKSSTTSFAAAGGASTTTTTTATTPPTQGAGAIAQTPSSPTVGSTDSSPKNSVPGGTVTGTTTGHAEDGASGLGSSSSSDSSRALILRGVVDPSTVDELSRAEAGQDPELELRALRRARGELTGYAGQLARRESELRQRAAQLRKIK